MIEKRSVRLIIAIVAIFIPFAIAFLVEGGFVFLNFFFPNIDNLTFSMEICILLEEAIPLIIIAYIYRKIHQGKETISQKDDLNFGIFFKGLVGAYITQIAAINVLTIISCFLPAGLIRREDNIAPYFVNNGNVAGLFIVLVCAVILAPILEEMLFRGILFKVVRESLSFWPSAVIASIIFGLGHLSPYLAWVMFFEGMWLAMLYERFGSIKLNIFVHGTMNLIVCLIAIFSEPETTEITNTPIYASVIALIISIGIWVLIYRSIKK